MDKKKEYFCIHAGRYVPGCDFNVTRPSSLDYPCDHSVMFVMEKYAKLWERLLSVRGCLVFWPERWEVPEELSARHAMISCAFPRVEYCNFFIKNHIRILPEKEDMRLIGGAYISPNAQIGNDTVIMPGAYIGGGVKIGEGCYIGAGVKLMGDILMGKNVIIRENSVLGADGLSTERNPDGSAATMPQFGGIVIGSHVEIGANTVIARGAIDDTVIEDGCKLDNSVFISHNVRLGKNTFIVGETIMFGSSSTGERAFLSGNSTIRNKVSVGADAVVGMGAVVTKDVRNGATVMGNPSREKGRDTGEGKEQHG